MNPELHPALKAKSFKSSIDGVELAYWHSKPAKGTGRYIVLLHGGASNHTRWSEFVQNSSLSESCNILVPDIRGNGESMTRKNIDLAQWCEDVVDMLDTESAQSAVVIGHSLGAHLALHFANKFSDKTSGLVLIDPTLQAELAGRRGWTRRNPRIANFIVSIILFFNSLGLGRRNFPHKDLQQLDKVTREEIAKADSFAEIAERYSALGPILSALPVANYLRQCIAMVRPLPKLETIRMPTLVLLSGATTMGDFAENRVQSSRFPNHDLHVLHANHWPLTEAPVETRKAIDDWVSATWPEAHNQN